MFFTGTERLHALQVTNPMETSKSSEGEEEEEEEEERGTDFSGMTTTSSESLDSRGLVPPVRTEGPIILTSSSSESESERKQ